MSVNLVKYTILHLNGTETNGEMDADHRVMLPNLRALWEEVSPGTKFERVRVFWPRVYIDLFVDETGMMKQLPVNYKATRMYRNNVIVHEKITNPEEIQDMPRIHGVAILFEKQIWY